MSQSTKKPWSITTVILVSIIFTPIIGGIIAGLNQIRLGFRKNCWREFLLSLFAFIWYSLYFFIVDEQLIQTPWGHMMPNMLLIYHLAFFYSARYAPLLFIFFLAVPFGLTVYKIALLQTMVWKQFNTNQIEVATWWSAFLLSMFLMFVASILLRQVAIALIVLIY